MKQGVLRKVSYVLAHVWKSYFRLIRKTSIAEQRPCQAMRFRGQSSILTDVELTELLTLFESSKVIIYVLPAVVVVLR